MEALAALVIFTFAGSLLAALGFAASIWGTDSRPQMADDHAR
jgi:hypothetical protein